MVDLIKACEKAKKELNSKGTESFYMIKETDGKFFFFGGEEGKPVYGGYFFLYVDKESGNHEWIDPYDYLDELEDSKDVEIPKEYK